MEIKTILDELLMLLEKNGVKIRKDNMGGSGSGLCKLKEGYLFFVDNSSNSYEIALSCAKAIKEIVDVESIYLKPEIREFIEQVDT